MNRILALEPDAGRGARLQQLLRQHVNADLVLSTSAHAAITAMTETRPDLILTSAMLSTNDDHALVAHLRATPSLRHLPVLTIPPVVEAPAAEARSTGLMSRLLRRRQPQPSFPIHDIGVVITRIKEALEQSKDAVAAAPPVESPASLEPVGTSGRLSSGTRRRAQRWSLSDLPWLSSVKLPWGQHLRLLNISSSGMLVESSVRLSPGSATSFKISGPELALVVRARVVRCRVSTVDSLGVKYETAAAFDQPVAELVASGEEPTDAAMRLADLVASVETHAGSGRPAAELRAEFEAGVLQLIAAREVRLRDVPVAENDGRESVYFTIPTSDRSPAVLLVTFDANDRPSAEDFEVLTAAADVAAWILPLMQTETQATLRPATGATTLRIVRDSDAPLELQIA
jgi:CheY-like chemotaxis protein